MNRPQPGLCRVDASREKSMNREELATRLAELHRLLPTVDHVYMKGDSPDLMVRYEAKATPEQRQAAREFTQLVLEHADQFVEWARAPEPPEADSWKAKHETALKDDVREAEHGPVLNEDVRDSEALLRRGYSL
jgi:hypothetical protein